MQKRTSNAKLWISRVFFLSISILILLAMQSEVFSKTSKKPRWEIQGYAFKNTNTKSTKSNSLAVMGAFATSDEPTTEPIPLKFVFPTFSKYYVGIVIVNNSSADKDVTVTFELFGIRNGKEDAEFTVPGESTFLAYIDDTLGRPGFYTYKVGIKNLGSSKITLMLEDNDDVEVTE